MEAAQASRCQVAVANSLRGLALVCAVPLAVAQPQVSTNQAPPKARDVLVELQGEISIETRRAYAKIIAQCPPDAALANLSKAKGTVQRIDEADHELVNLDDYAIDILSLPRKANPDGSPSGDKSPTETPESLLEFIRVHLSQIVPTQVVSKLEAYDNASAAAWGKRQTAVGAIQVFSVVGKIGMPPPAPGYVGTAEQLAVVTVSADRFGWRFATAKIGFTLPGGHPLSGVREFGMRISPSGTLQFYTRAIDRLTGLLEKTVMAKDVMSGIDATWTGLMGNVKALIERNGGLVQPVVKTARSVPWRTTFVDAGLAPGKCENATVVSSSTLRPQAAVAAQLLTGADPSGALNALAVKSLSELRVATTADQRTEILGATRDAAKLIREAQTPTAMLDMLNSAQGQRFALSTFTRPWQESVGQFAIMGTGQSAKDSADLRGADPRALPKAVLRMTDEATRRDLGPWLQALTGDSSAVTPSQIAARVVPPEQRQLVEVAANALMSVASSGKLTVDQKTLADSLLRSASGEVRARIQDINKVRQQASDGAEAFDTLRELSLNNLGDKANRAKTVAAVAVIADIAGGLLNDKSIGPQVRRAAAQAQAAMQVVEAVSVLAAVGTGGTAIAAMGALSALGAMGTGVEDAAQTQAMLKEIQQAIADLTNLVREEFDKVNSKLDTMSGQLRDISDQLKEQKVMLARTQLELGQLREQLSWVQVSLGWVHASLQESFLTFWDVPCRNIRLDRYKLEQGAGSARQKFHDCLGAYRARALVAAALPPQNAVDEDMLSLLGPQSVNQTLRPFSLYAPIARAAPAFLQIDAKPEFMSGNYAVQLASVTRTVEGMTQYLDWADRYGREYLVSPPDKDGTTAHGRLVAQDELASRFAVTLELEEAFRRAHRSLSAADLAKRVRSWVTAAESQTLFSLSERDALSHIPEPVLRSTGKGLLSAQAGPAATRRFSVAETIPVAGCNGMALPKGLPRVLQWNPGTRIDPVWRSFGVGNEIATVKAQAVRGIDVNVPTAALRVCAEIDGVGGLDGKEPRKFVVNRSLRATIKISFAGATETTTSSTGGREGYCALTESRYSFGKLHKAEGVQWLDPEPDSFDELLRGLLDQTLDSEACKWARVGPDKSSNLPALLAAQVLNNAHQHEAFQVELLGRLWQEILASPGQALGQDVEAGIKPLMARIAFLRGFLALVYPEAWARDDEMRRILQSDATYQTGSASRQTGLFGLMACGGKLADSVNATAAGTVSLLSDEHRKKLGECGVSISNGFAWPQALTMGTYGSARLLQVADRLETHWVEVMDQPTTSERAWLRARLHNFIKNGGGSAYYDRVTLPR